MRWWARASLLVGLWSALCLSVCEARAQARLEGSSTERLEGLNALVRDLVSAHPLVKARRFEVQAQREGLRASLGLLDPTLQLSLDGNSDLVSFANPAAQGALTDIETNRYSAQLSLTQPLRWGTLLGLSFNEQLIATDNPFRNCVPGLPSEQCYEARLSLTLTQPLLRGRDAEANGTSVRLAERALRGAQLQAQRQLEGLVYELVNAYINLALSDAQRALERGEVTLAEQHLKESQARVEAGVLASSELASAELSLAQRLQAQLSAERLFEEQRAALKSLTSHPLPKRFELPRWLSEGEGLAAAPLSTSPSLSDHLELALIDEQLAQLEAQLTQRRDQARPELNASLVWSQSGLGEGLQESLKALPDNKSRFYGATLTFRYDLSDRAEGSLAQTLAQRASLEAEREATARRLEGEWEQLRLTRPLLSAQLSQAERAMRAAKLSAEATQGRLEAGLATSFELEQRREVARAAEHAALQARYALVRHHLNSLRLRGELLNAFGLEVEARPAGLSVGDAGAQPSTQPSTQPSSWSR